MLRLDHTPFYRGPVLYLPLGYPYGTRDISGHGNHGVAAGNAHAVASYYDGAFSFDGVGDYITAPDIDLYNGSINLWAFMTDNSRDQRIYEHGPTGGGAAGAFLLWYDVGNDCWAVRVRDSAAHWQADNTGSPVHLDKWTMLTITYSGGDSALYVDGRLIASDSSLTGGLSTAGSDVVIGDMPNFSNPFTGLLDEVATFDYALTPTQIRWLYHHPTGLRTADHTFLEMVGGTGVPVPVFYNYYRMMRGA